MHIEFVGIMIHAVLICECAHNAFIAQPEAKCSQYLWRASSHEVLHTSSIRLTAAYTEDILTHLLTPCYIMQLP